VTRTAPDTVLYLVLHAMRDYSINESFVQDSVVNSTASSCRDARKSTNSSQPPGVRMQHLHDR